MTTLLAFNDYLTLTVDFSSQSMTCLSVRSMMLTMYTLHVFTAYDYAKKTGLEKLLFETVLFI